jgi:hypothetical protein
LNGSPDFTPSDRQIVMIANATHIAWSQGPYFYYPTWSEEVAYHYTLAWFDKYLHDDVSRTMGDVAGNVINSVSEVADYAECFGGPDCYTATDRLKMVHPQLSDTWCSRYDVGGDATADMKGGGCQTQ